MKIVFIPGKYYHEAEDLTPHKVYDVYETTDDEYYKIKNDKGQVRDYYYNRFVELSKYRKSQIEELLK